MCIKSLQVKNKTLKILDKKYDIFITTDFLNKMQKSTTKD